MTFDQTRSIIDHAREFHEQVGEYYHRLADAAQRTRVRMLLDYMSEHEQRLAAALAAYEDAAPAKILDTWLQSNEEAEALEAVRAHLSTTPFDPALEVEDLTQLGIQLSECLLTVYRDLAARAEPSSVRQVFENLLCMEEKAQQQFARDAGRVRDL